MTAISTKRTTSMADPAGSEQSLLRLMTWLSPAFPVGAFSFSHGLERAVEDGLVSDRDQLAAWIGDLIGIGSGWNDLVLFAEAWWRGDDAVALEELNELAEALCGSKERQLETMAQGAAFADAVRVWPRLVLDLPGGKIAYPVAVGAAAGTAGIGLEDALTAYLQTFASNLVQAALRLLPIGQNGGLAVMVRLEPVILETVGRAAAATLDDLGSATILSEITAMNHETQKTRIFRT